MTQTSTPKTLYDRDLNLWLEETVAKLKARQDYSKNPLASNGTAWKYSTRFGNLP